MIDLDKNNSIQNYYANFNVQNQILQLIQLISIIKKNATYVCDSCDTIEYKLNVKYLKQILEIIFQISNDSTYINIIYCNGQKIYLKINLSDKNDPVIKYYHDDETKNAINYADDKIKLEPEEYMIHFSHALLSFFGFRRVRLDDSEIFLQSNLNVKLWLYHLLTKNCSWYTKFGYEPDVCMSSELNLLINDVKNIKLNKVYQCLVDNHIESDLTVLIEGLTDTLGQYIVKHDIVEFTNLANLLYQSTFNKSEFFWYKLMEKLYFANLSQVNNNVTSYFYQIYKKN